jgi:hypothetical protein
VQIEGALKDETPLTLELTFEFPPMNADAFIFEMKRAARSEGIPSANLK